MVDSFSRFADNLSNNADFQQARLEARGVPMAQAMQASASISQRNQAAAAKGKVQEILAGAQGRELTENEVLQLFAIDPATAKFIVEQQAAKLPDLQHKINPLTGEEMVIDKKTATRVDGGGYSGGGGGGGYQPSFEDLSPITVPNQPPSTDMLEIPPEIKGNPAAEQKFKEAVATKKGTQAAAEQANRPKVANKMRGSLAQFDSTIKILEEALPDVNNLTAGFASITAAIPGTPASDLAQKLEPVLARAGFGTLQEMRDNSPTGGALGSVSEREISLLQSAEANISTAQSPEQLRKAITEYKEQLKSSKAAIEAAYIKDFGSLPSAEDDIKNMSTEELEEMLRQSEES